MSVLPLTKEQALGFRRFWAEGFYKGLTYQEALCVFVGSKDTVACKDIRASSWQELEAMLECIIYQH